jgi:hypothetical protein
MEMLKYFFGITGEEEVKEEVKEEVINCILCEKILTKGTMCFQALSPNPPHGILPQEPLPLWKCPPCSAFTKQNRIQLNGFWQTYENGKYMKWRGKDVNRKKVAIINSWEHNMV